MSFFKAYDMRGTFGVDFNLDTVYRAALNLPGVTGAKRWLVGRDCRATSEDVRSALVAGLNAAGAEVSDLGLCTTPMVYFFTAQDGYDGSVMVTASHNPPTDNGLKVSRKGALPVGYKDGLDKVQELAQSSSECYSVVNADTSVFNVVSPLERYLEWQKRAVSPREYAKLRFAVDCSNGMASLFAREVFPDAEILNGVMDGSFPCHSPNPLKAEAREEAAEFVREHNLDCAVIFDGDADRAMFIDESGEFVQCDMLTPILAKACGVSNGDTVIHDVRTSRGAIEAIRELGATPLMVSVGHAFAKPIMRSSGAICGGELAGHYYFRDFACCDSGLLAATRILSEIAKAKRRGISFSELMRPITSRYANSGEINFRVDDKASARARALAAARSHFGEPVKRIEIDGIRDEYPDGWFNIRESNTEPYLRLIAECRTADMLGEWLYILRGAILAE